MTSRRLVELGADGVGGYLASGERALPAATLDAWTGPWRDAVAIGASIARALSACERASLFPGAIAPANIHVEGTRAVLAAEPLVASLEGKPHETRPSARWTAPEQAAGAHWDNAANRYVLGLIVYRLIAGEHPFSKKGLRHALGDQARGAPPFPDAIARELPPGLQALCLRMLDPDARERPASAREIAERFESFLKEKADPGLPVRRGIAPAGPAEKPVRVAAARRRRLGAALPIAVGVVLALAIRAFAGAPAVKPQLPARAALSSGTTKSGDCAACHARQAAEWRRSVMAQSVESPMFESLESLIEEQVGRSDECPDGAGILRSLDPRTACRDRASGLPVTGSGGELWCVNCHAPGENLRASLPAWDATARTSQSRLPLRDLLPDATMEGISCGFCHQVHGPVHPGDAYQGNAFWTSTRTNERFRARPEDARGVFGIANSGYAIDPRTLLGDTGAGGVHARPDPEAKRYLGSSRFCGSCHDVRLFGTDVLGVRDRGEHFKRLRNAYSEWVAYADEERRAGRTPASCQGCHMSSYPGVCVAGAGKPRVAGLGSAEPVALERGCPPGTHFEARAPGSRPLGRVAVGSARSSAVTPHYFSGVDIPLAASFSGALVDEPGLDAAGTPLGARQRRDLLLGASVRFDLGDPSRRGGSLEVPITVENVGAGHRIPAGFSQERELWVHLRVTDARGDLVYESGRVDRDDEDLRDRRFLRVNVDDRLRNGVGSPLGVFGADVADGPDIGRWSPRPDQGGTRFRGRGLVNFQNGFLRCVTCIGRVAPDGRCEALPGQDGARADRFADGDYDIDTGECRSNLTGRDALLETYFPVGALDATRGVAKGPDAIIDTRSLAPRVPVTYSFELSTRGHPAPFHVKAQLLFRAFPPYLVRAFAAYERVQAARGLRPSGPLITEDALRRVEIVEIARAQADAS